jgi:hypothetical protein
MSTNNLKNKIFDNNPTFLNLRSEDIVKLCESNNIKTTKMK